MLLKRILAIAIDFWMFQFLFLPSFALPMAFNLEYIDLNTAFNVYMFSVLIGMIIKDTVFKNASLGKKLLKIEIRFINNEIPSTISLIFRNFFLIIFPIEVLFIIINKNRIGDILFETEVVEVIKNKKLLWKGDYNEKEVI